MNEAHVPQGPPMVVESSHSLWSPSRSCVGCSFLIGWHKGIWIVHLSKGWGSWKSHLNFPSVLPLSLSTVLFLTPRSSCYSYLEDQAVPWEQVMLWRLCFTRSWFPVSAMEARRRPPMVFGGQQTLKVWTIPFRSHVVNSSNPHQQNHKKGPHRVDSEKSMICNYKHKWSSRYQVRPQRVRK